MKVPAHHIIGGGPKAARKEADFYPTPAECTDSLLAAEKEVLDQSWTILEPCCGDGAISKRLEAHRFSVQSSDLHDRGYGTPGVDFLSLRERTCDGMITNPPFALAEAVIDQARWLDFRYVALVLKSTFWHARRRGVLFALFPPSRIYAMTWRPDFDGRGAPTMDCIWCVWDRRVRGQPTEYRLLNRGIGKEVP